MGRAGIIALLVAGTAAEAQVVRPVLKLNGEYTTSVTIDRAGTAVYAVSSTNQFGTNPDYVRQIVRWDPVTGAGTPITDFEEGVTSASVSDDGSWLAFVSRADLVGTNHDESPELYVMHPDGTGVAQLTFGSFLPLRDRGVHAAFISGSGNRIAFIGQIDPLGTNPNLESALFVIDRDGTNLTQLDVFVLLFRANFYTYAPVDISDDGNRIAYLKRASGDRMYGINANGKGKHELTSTGAVAEVAISGNGARVAYTNYDYAAGTRNVCTRTFDGDPTTVLCAPNLGESPVFTDDASFVYYYQPDTAQIWKFPGAGPVVPTLISAPRSRIVALSGSGNRIAARGTELFAMDAAGGSLQQLTTTAVPAPLIQSLPWYISFSADASAFYFTSQMDPLGTNPTWDYEQFAFSLGTGQFTQLTDGSLPQIYSPSFSDNGTIVYSSSANLTGQNPCGRNQIFRWVPGGPLTQLTACGGFGGPSNAYPAVSGDGEVVAYVAYQSGPWEQAFSVRSDGTGLTQVVPQSLFVKWTQRVFHVASGEFRVGSDNSPTWVAFRATINFSDYHVFRVRADGSALQQVTSVSGYPDQSDLTISGNGGRLAWIDNGNHAGQNPDGSYETFAFDASTASIRQITSDGDYAAYQPRVTRDGSYVFLAESRYDFSTSLHEPVTAGFDSADVQPDATGSRWLITTSEQLETQAVPWPQHQAFFLADMTAVPTFSVGKGSTTELSWDRSPTSFRYDAIRGSIANLSIAGSTVSLGPVSCLEDDSPDSHTRGHGDPAVPALGQAFFYLYRGTVGFDLAAGSYGQGTGGKERVAAAGDCNP